LYFLLLNHFVYSIDFDLRIPQNCDNLFVFIPIELQSNTAIAGKLTRVGINFILNFSAPESSQRASPLTWYRKELLRNSFFSQPFYCSYCIFDILPVVKTPSDNLTVPPGNVPIVLCAAGAQCKPTRESMPNSSSNLNPTSETRLPAIVNDTMGVDFSTSCIP
jgi:hypothetical protein